MTEITKNTNTNTMEAKKLKMVRGSKEHPELVREWLKSQGATNTIMWCCDSEYDYYFVIDNSVRSMPDNFNLIPYIDHEVVELEEPKPRHVFQPFEKVLVRDASELSNYHKWEIAFFGRIDDQTGKYIAAGGGGWDECIPYEGNEHLLGTTDASKGGER